MAVFPLEILAGDSTSEDLGSYAAFWITDGLSRADEVRVVTTTTVLDALRAQGDGASPQSIASDLGAGRMVTGVGAQQGDTLELSAQITSVATGDVIHSVRASGTADKPKEVVEALIERVMAALAVSLGDPDAAPWISQPPSYDAYQAYARGVPRFYSEEWTEALRHYEEAYRARHHVRGGAPQCGRGIQQHGATGGGGLHTSRSGASPRRANPDRPALARVVYRDDSR